MPYSPEEKKRAINRLRRIKGQAASLEEAVAEGTDCASVLQQLAAMRGAVNGLMRDVMQGHFDEVFAKYEKGEIDANEFHSLKEELTESLALMRSYIK